jgi:hypothetical protein
MLKVVSKEIKGPGYEVNHLPSSSAKGNKDWSYVSTSSHVLIACKGTILPVIRLVKHACILTHLRWIILGLHNINYSVAERNYVLFKLNVIDNLFEIFIVGEWTIFLAGTHGDIYKFIRLIFSDIVYKYSTLEGLTVKQYFKLCP